MKYQYLLSLFFLVVITTNSNAQNYLKTLEENKKWILSDDIGMGVQVKPRYYVSCDTMMNGYQYYKLWDDNPNFRCKGYLREDTTTQRVHFMPLDFSSEMLIADYLLMPGDTFAFTHQYNNQIHTIVDTVSHLDTILIDQVPHKRIHFLNFGTIVNGPNLVFTEGQGDNFSGVAHHLPVITNQITLNNVYLDSTVTCGLISSIDDLNQIAYNINIYPNPTQKVLNIDINTKNLATAYFLKITNLSGQVVQTKEIYSNRDTIYIDQLNKGIYFIHVFDENRMISVRKFIKN